jgi:hypothetical protein
MGVNERRHGNRYRHAQKQSGNACFIEPRERETALKRKSTNACAYSHADGAVALMRGQAFGLQSNRRVPVDGHADGLAKIYSATPAHCPGSAARNVATDRDRKRS